MLISTMITEIISETGGDTSDTTLQTLIYGFIKSAMRRLPRHTRTRLLIDTSYATLSSGSHYIYPLPSDFIKERYVYYINNGNRINIPKLSFDDFNSQFNSTATGSPQSGYRIIGDKVEFLRSADQDYVIYIEYFKSVDEIATTDGFFGSSDMIEIVKDGAKYYYFDYEEDDKKATEKLALFKAGLDKLEADYLSDEIPDYVEES